MRLLDSSLDMTFIRERMRRVVSLRASQWAKLWDPYHPGGQDFVPSQRRLKQRLSLETGGKGPKSGHSR